MNKPEKRRAITEDNFFSKSQAMRRYLIALVSAPAMLGVIMLTRMDYATCAALVICVAGYGLFSFLTLLNAWNAAAAQLELSGG